MIKKTVMFCGLLMVGACHIVQARLSPAEEKTRQLIEDFLDTKKASTLSWTCFLNQLHETLVKEPEYEKTVKELYAKLFKLNQGNLVDIAATLEDGMRVFPDEIKAIKDKHGIFELKTALERSFAPAKKKCEDKLKKKDAKKPGKKPKK